MAESFGDYMLEKFTQGVEELRAANSGQMAMNSPPIEAPQVEAPQSSSYDQMIAQVAQQPSMDQGQGIER